MFAGVGAQAACVSWDQVSVLDSCEVIAERRDMEKSSWFESSCTIARNPCCSVMETQTNVFKLVVFEGIQNQSHFVMMIIVGVSVSCTIVYGGDGEWTHHSMGSFAYSGCDSWEQCAFDEHY